MNKMMEERITCKPCVKMDEVFQTCLDDLLEAWDNVGYHIGEGQIHCPSCGELCKVIE